MCDVRVTFFVFVCVCVCVEIVDHSNTQLSQMLDIAPFKVASTKLAALSQRLITTSIKLGLECLPYLFNELVVLEALPGLHHPHNGRLCVKLPVLLY